MSISPPEGGLIQTCPPRMWLPSAPCSTSTTMLAIGLQSCREVVAARATDQPQISLDNRRGRACALDPLSPPQRCRGSERFLDGSAFGCMILEASSNLKGFAYLDSIWTTDPWMVGHLYELGCLAWELTSEGF